MDDKDEVSYIYKPLVNNNISQFLKNDVKNLDVCEEKLELLNYINGGTSCIKVLQDILTNKKYISKSYKKENVVFKWCNMRNKDICDYHNELSSLKVLNKYEHFPIVIKYDQSKLSILSSYCGLTIRNKNIIIPKNWKQQIKDIYTILAHHCIYHNDVWINNICLYNNIIYLIDFGNSKKHIDYPYFNFSEQIIDESKDIYQMLNTIDKIGHYIISCLYMRRRK